MPKRTAEESGLPEGSPNKKKVETQPIPTPTPTITSPKSSPTKSPKSSPIKSRSPTKAQSIDADSTQPLVPDPVPVEQETENLLIPETETLENDPKVPEAGADTEQPLDGMDTQPNSETDKEEQGCTVLDLKKMSDRDVFEHFLEAVFKVLSVKTTRTMSALDTVEELRKTVDTYLDKEDPQQKKLALDNAFREYLLHVIGFNCPNCAPWHELVDIGAVAAREDVATISLPFQLLADLIDFIDFSPLELVFKYIEERIKVWLDAEFYNPCKNSVLRMCNDLLKRLSQTQNTIFCGRVLIFLATYFPFSERSGLNVMSEFNTDSTAYRTLEGDDKVEVGAEQVESNLFEGMNINIPGLDKVVAQCQQQKKKSLTLDYNMYVKFWSLQDFLRNPNQCYNKTNWKSFTTYANDLLDAFESSKLLDDSEKDDDEPSEDLDGEVDMETLFQNAAQNKSGSLVFSIPFIGDEDQYFAKYLTNRKVLELEMSDPGFRRSFLVQLLIVLQYLPMTVKFKHESYVLTDEQLQFVTKTMDRIYDILSEIKPGGTMFVGTVKHMLKREEIWNKWKNEGCQPIKKPTPTVVVSALTKNSKDTDEGLKTPSGIQSSDGKDGDELSETNGTSSPIPEKPSLGDIIRRADEEGRFVFGNSELDRLWNINPNNMESCRSKTRDFMPSIETYFAEAMKEIDFSNTAPFDPKKEIKPKKILGNQNFGWRGLRLLARKSPYFFQMFSGQPIYPMQVYLEFILKKINADMEAGGAAHGASPSHSSNSLDPSNPTSMEQDPPDA